ncbi:Carbonic anhydrase or acetyltransferase, isoleucine patch superfamily [Cyclobacterium xiamenense]|uniref:Carbonic anhydrase or acetyltransferase, isoleucine patch superfamily n=1 Tax=Cyclobacterium xiamenense TaxID=1297121 RepID=A0A1H7B8C4_9BACT|nr:gamma carbonic anhydrase family protein [Cyclobacterium xiamenense]SEJ74041.1 Carbonic anhydrase or acetyltransferase, isoleucine patch superfamily [Cyclobacterium xiamenense]
MALVKSIENKTPQFGSDCWLADTATIIGDVIMGKQCTVWFNAVVRGDVHSIRMGDRTNVQDGAIIHCTYQKFPVTIGSDVSIAHGAIVHGCTLADRVLVGMGAIVMDGAQVGEGAVIAAGAVVLEGTVVEKNSIYAGIPAKKVKDTGPEMQETIRRIAANYPRYASWYREES